MDILTRQDYQPDSNTAAPAPALPAHAPEAARIDKDAILKGEITKCQALEVYGVVDGKLKASHLTVHASGKVIGTLNVETAQINGIIQGDIVVTGLLSIGASGSVTGNVTYGQISMAKGAELSAELRNIPPTLGGDLDVSVKKGGSVVITTNDLTAYDPDDDAKDLEFSVIAPKGGFVALQSAPDKPVTSFRQIDLEARKIIFVHDGNSSPASFDTQIKDASGATSGTPQTVHVNVQ